MYLPTCDITSPQTHPFLTPTSHQNHPRLTHPHLTYPHPHLTHSLLTYSHPHRNTTHPHPPLTPAVQSQMPRRESARRNHPLARECDIVETLHMRLTLLQMTFGKHIERKHICFFPGEVSSCDFVAATCSS